MVILLHWIIVLVRIIIKWMLKSKKKEDSVLSSPIRSVIKV